MDSPELKQEFQSTPELLEKLYKYSVSKEYQAGDVIVDENSSIRAIPIVTKGAMKVVRTEEDGREILLYYIKRANLASCLFWAVCTTKPAR